MREKKLLKEIKYLIERYFPEMDVEYSSDELVVRLKDGNSGGSSSGHN